jgi:integrase
MGTIIPRRRKDGSTGYLAQIIKKRDGRIVLREAQTFDRKAAAQAWIAKRESDLATPDGLERSLVPKGTLSDAIDKYTATSRREIGRTKEQVLRSIKGYDIAGMDCAAIRSSDIVDFAEELSKGRKPQTVGNYISHLSAVFRIARPAWGLPLNYQTMREAHLVLNTMGITSKSAKRERRPTLAEINTLMQHFAERAERAPQSTPMHKIVAFALFSTRRQEEITRITWNDLDEPHSRILVRDMKHPGQKIGNDVWVELPDEALAIIKAMPRIKSEVFPYSTDAISASFTRVCHLLQIKDLHFHDLRHDGVSRLFEMGRTIPQVASVSGHRSWQSLQRYTHLRATGDKYAGWPWLAKVSKSNDQSTTTTT